MTLCIFFLFFEPTSYSVRLCGFFFFFLEVTAFEEGLQLCTGTYSALLSLFFPMGEVMKGGGLAHQPNAALIVAPRWVSES